MHRPTLSTRVIATKEAEVVSLKLEKTATAGPVPAQREFGSTTRFGVMAF